LYAAAATCFQNQGEFHGEQDHAEVDRPRTDGEQKDGAGCSGDQASGPETSGKLARHSIDAGRDQDGEDCAEDAHPQDVLPFVEKGEQDLVAPAVGSPGAVCGGGGKNTGMGEGVVLENPVSYLQVPPVIEIPNRKLERKTAPNHKGEEGTESGQLENA